MVILFFKQYLSVYLLLLGELSLIFDYYFFILITQSYNVYRRYNMYKYLHQKIARGSIERIEKQNLITV